MAIKGMEFLEDLGRDIETDINKAVNDSILTVANKLVEVLRQNTTKSEFSTGDLERSISALPLRQEGSKWIIEIEWEEYGNFVDAGVAGSKTGTSKGLQYGYNREFKYTDKVPPASVFERYARAKGISPYAVARSIFNKGLKGSGWATETIESREVQDLVDDIATLIVNQYE